MDNRRVFESFDSGSATQQVERILFSLNPITMRDDYELNTLLLTQGVVELNERKVFLEGVAAYLGGYDVADTAAMLKEVQRRYSEKGIELKKAVKGWFQKADVSPSTDQSYRRNLYDFCVAMGMDYITTAEFFWKSFLTIPFNYKDRDDAVYFYCLKAGCPYNVIQRMLGVADNLEVTNSEVSSTEYIGAQILDIDSDEDFLQYLCHHCYDRKHQYNTAKKKVAALIEANKKIVPGKQIIKGGEDKSEIELLFDNLGTKKNSTLLQSILGYRYQGLDQMQRTRIRECGLPVFPRDGDITDVLSSENESSFDVLRKTLILMKFYNYYRNLQVKTKCTEIDAEEINDYLFEFFDETNDELARCGFVQMYPRNPYDWIILFCANSPNPIDYLKDFIQKRYLGDLDN